MVEMPDDAPAFSELEREACTTVLCGSDMFVRYDGWEYYLGEMNGPCRPSVDLDGYNTEYRFYDDKVVVFHEIPERDESWEIKFSLRNIYPEDSV